MARSLYLRLALALLAALPTSLLYLSTVIDLPFHLLPGGGYRDQAAAVALDDVLYIACAAYAAASLLCWTWIAGQRSLAGQFFALPRLARLARPLTFFFLVLLPAVLIAAQVVQEPRLYRDLLSGGRASVDALLSVAFDGFAAFTACAQLWFGIALQVQLHAFEVGQDGQRYTRKLYFLYSPTPASSSSSSSSSSSPASASSEQAGEVENAAMKRAYELSTDPAYSGFTKSVMSINEFEGNTFVREGAMAVIFVLDPFAFPQGVRYDEMTKWLSEEASLRSYEAADVGPCKNIVYTPEGTRRIAFLRVKFCVYALLPEFASLLPPPPVDIPRFIDEWLSQFGAHRLLPLSSGEGEEFGRWKAELGRTLETAVVNPDAKSPLMRRSSNEPYMGWFDFLRWLDACTDPTCAVFHRYEVEKLRERPSKLLPRFVDYVWWFLFWRNAPVQIERRYDVFGKVNRKLASATCAVIAACLAIFLPLRLHYYPTINQVSFFTSFTGLVCLAHFLWSVLAARGRRSSHESTTNSYPENTSSTNNMESLGVVPSPTHADRIGLNDSPHATETSRLIPSDPSPSSGTVLPAKYHFHTNVDHYHQEVRDKAESESEAPIVVNPYCPLPHSGPLLRVPYTCPLLDETTTMTCDDVARDGFTHVYGRDNEPLFDEDFEEHDALLPPVFGGDKDAVRWHREEAGPETGGEGKAKEASPATPEEALIVNPTFEFQPTTIVPYFCVWTEEFLYKHFANEPIVLVTLPGTGLPLPFQLSDARERAERERELHALIGQRPNNVDITINVDNVIHVDASEEKVASLVRLFGSLRPGLPLPRELIDHDSALVQKLIQSEIVVTESYWRKRVAYFKQQNERARHELRTDGFTVLKNLLPKRHLHFLRRYYRRLFQALGGQPIADKYKMQKCQWNDEPSSRFINHYLTSMIHDLVQEPVLHPGLALSIWIMKGEGFPLHTDSVPPFDLTLDFVLDHVGPQPRPVTFIRRRRGALGSLLPGVEEMTLKLQVGEAVLFRGSEMPHFGGDLGEGNYHNVLLWTWSYVRD